MKTGTIQPEWDTPSDGDFARYVERLTAAKPAPATTMAAAPVTARKLSAAPAQALPPDLASLLAPFVRGLRIVRGVLLLFMVLHGIALFAFRQGSFPGLAVMAAFWWGLGWLLAAARVGAPGKAAATQKK